MKNNFLFLFIFSLFFTPLVYSQKRNLELADIWGKRHLFIKPVKGFRSMPDGQRYSEMVENETTKATDVLIFDYKSGKILDTLLHGDRLFVTGSDTILRFSDYALNENASLVVLKTEEEAIYRHSTKANHYIYNVAKHNLLAVSEKGKQMYATISPSGNLVAFVRENNLVIKDMISGAEKPVTTDGKKNEIINGANDWVYEEEFSFSQSYQWSEDGNKIAYYRFDESRVPEYTLTIYDHLYPDQEKYKYPKAGENNSFVEIFIYDVLTGKTVKADIGTVADQYIPRIKWTVDANILSVQRLNRHQNKLELLLCDGNSGKARVILTEESSSYVDVNDDLTFLKDKEHFIWTSSRDGYNHIYYYNMSGVPEKQITKGTWEVTNYYGCDEKTNTFYYQSTERGPESRQVYSISSDGKKKLISQPNGTNDAEFSTSFKYFFNVFSSAEIPNVYAVYGADGKQLRVLEDNKQVTDSMKTFNLGKLEFFTFKTSANDVLHGWMIKSADFDSTKKHPVLQFMYGGPGKQEVTDKWRGPDYFWFQMLAQKGYVVVCVDNRGTQGRGDAFLKCTYKNLGLLEELDQVEVAKYMGSLPYVDAARIGVFGWSYGGYLTSLLMTKGADYFKAGIAVAPITNWRFYDTIYTERFLQTPQENPAGYDMNSPLNFSRLLKGKFLLIHGTADDNVHFQNSMEFVNALVKDKKQIETFFYPNKAHGIGGVRLHLYTKMTDFILTNL